MPESLRANNRPAPPPRRRPKDRKAQIARAAAEAFSTYGYNQVGIDDIAAEVGISGPALYRHFPNKYALFRHVAFTLADVLVDASSLENDNLLATHDDRLDAILRRIITATLDNRYTGGLYRWEHRYLQAADRREVRNRIATVNGNIARELAGASANAAEKEHSLRATAALSVIGSVTAHRTTLSDKRIQAVILEAAHSVLAVDAGAVPPLEPAPSPERGLAPHSKRELLLRAAIELFCARGYHDVSIEEIGAAAGLNASGVYRYFESKADLLGAAFTRASERLSAATSLALADAQSPLQALRGFVDVYVRLSFAQQDLMSVYFTEIGNLPQEQRRTLRHIQRLNVEEWAAQLAQVHTGRQSVELTFLVHAALAITFDVGRRLNYEQTPAAEGLVAALMRAAMLID